MKSGIHLWIILLCVGGSAPVRAESPWRLGAPQTVVASAGVFELLEERENDAEAGAELWFAPRRFAFLPAFVPELSPVVGVMATSRSTLYGYAGFRFELPLRSGWTASPSFAVGLYEDGDGKNLGGPLEFRSGIELAYRFRDGSRLGLCLYHLSNAGLYRLNPGSESLVLTFVPGRLR